MSYNGNYYKAPDYFNGDFTTSSLRNQTAAFIISDKDYDYDNPPVFGCAMSVSFTEKGTPDSEHIKVGGTQNYVGVLVGLGSMNPDFVEWRVLKNSKNPVPVAKPGARVMLAQNGKVAIATGVETDSINIGFSVFYDIKTGFLTGRDDPKATRKINGATWVEYSYNEGGETTVVNLNGLFEQEPLNA